MQPVQGASKCLKCSIGSSSRSSSFPRPCSSGIGSSIADPHASSRAYDFFFGSFFGTGPISGLLCQGRVSRTYTSSPAAGPISNLSCTARTPCAPPIRVRLTRLAKQAGRHHGFGLERSIRTPTSPPSCQTSHLPCSAAIARAMATATSSFAHSMARPVRRRPIEEQWKVYSGIYIDCPSRLLLSKVATKGCCWARP